VRLRLAAALALAVCGPAAAQTLTLGLAADVTSADPHFHNTSSNNAASRHVFETLIRQDARQRLVPGLALDWRATGATTWEIALRPGVRFHDGTPLTAGDVAASLRRAGSLAGSPSSFALYTRAIVAVEVGGPLLLRITTRAPHPLLPNDLSLVPVIAARHAAAPTEAFDRGAAAVGTGPYRFAAFAAGQRMVVERNPAHWEGPQPWARVDQRVLRQGAARAAALLAGDVDAIEAPPPETLDRLAGQGGLVLSRSASNKVVFLFPDVGRDPTPFVTDAAGRPISPNPLRDPRVRAAISLAIDRAAIAERVLNGEGLPAGQLVPEGMFGADPALRPDAHDPVRARRLLAEAGFPDGFTITLHGPNDRFLRDAAVLQAVGAMLERVGIRARVETLPWATYAARSQRPEFSLMLVGWGAGTGEASSPLRGLLATRDAATGLGASNRGGWSDARFDALLGEALRTPGDAAREALLRQAGARAMAERALIPLHFEAATWAHRRGLSHAPRVDQYTQAMDFRPR
jgi:peptide/nickel transport system substrate-binding protein